MTTNVKIDAHCSESVEVVVTVSDGGDDSPLELILQDGESSEQYVYHDRVITVMEREKQ